MSFSLKVFAYNPKGQIQHDRLCLTAQHGSRAALLSICNRDQTTNANQRWIYKVHLLQLYAQHLFVEVQICFKAIGPFRCCKNNNKKSQVYK